MMHLKVSSPAVLACVVLALFGAAMTAVPFAAAVSPGGTVNFYDVSGTGASSVCTSTTWNGGTFSDGNQGFGGNLGSAQSIPIVANGEEICIQIILTDQAASTSYTVSDPGGFLSLVKGTNPFSTDASGNANVNLIFSVSGLTGTCMTHPIQISPDVSGGSGSANMIHHYYGGNGACGGTTPFPPPPQGAPQFALGPVATALMMAAGLSGLLLIKKKQLN